MGLGADDKEAVRELFSRYAWGYDCRDYEAVGETFLPDGVLIGPEGPLSGRAAIQAWMHAHVQEHHADKVMQHHIDHLLIEGDETRCRAQSYWTVIVHYGDGSCGVGSLGWYDDTLVKLDGQWFFEERRFNLDMPDRAPWRGRPS